jgi:hypothetical protein
MFHDCSMPVLTFPGFPKVICEESSHGAVLRHGGALARFLQFRGSRAWPLIGAADGQGDTFILHPSIFPEE